MGKFHNRKDTKRIGERIKQLRLEYSWSVEDIAAMTGFSRATISKIEKGGETNTTHLVEIAKAIGVRPVELFNVPFEIRPRYRLSQKRKDQKKITLKVKSFIQSGYFREARQVADVKKYLLETYKLKISAAQISVILLRMVKEGVLNSSRKGRKNEYFSGKFS